MTDSVLDLGGYLSVGLVEPIGLEHRIPTKHVFTAWLHNLPVATADKSAWLSVRTLTEGKDALAIGRLVIKALYHLPEPLAAHSFQEVLAIIHIGVQM